MDLSVEGRKEDLGEVGGGAAIIRICCMEKISNKKIILKDSKILQLYFKMCKGNIDKQGEE